MKNFIKIIIIVAILVILVFLSVGIVRIVPRAVSSLASATVSLGSFFTGDGKTNATSTSSGVSTSTSTTGSQNGGGFVIIGATSTQANGSANGSSASSTDDRSLVNILRPGSTSGQNQNSNTNTGGTVSNPKPTTGGTSYVSNSCTNGRVSDLAVRILSRGVINKATGQYIETNSFTSSDTVVVKFIAENRGTCPTGIWSLRVDMPSQNTSDQIRNIVNVGSLPAGSTVTGQANFDSPRVGASNITLTVTDNSGRDSNTSNNVVSTAITTIASNTGTNPGVPTTGDGRPDLIVRILRMGTLGFNNQFIPNTSSSVNYGGNFRAGERMAVQFEVVNQGQTPTGAWTWRADSSVFPNGTYTNTQYEPSIPSGSKLIYTIGFDTSTIGTNSVSIFADHLNQVNEFNESNNNASVSFNVGY